MCRRTNILGVPSTTYIFHIKLDITGTGLKYEIGESLGIHGRNNSDVVEEFLQNYGVDGDSLVEVSN